MFSLNITNLFKIFWCFKPKQIKEYNKLFKNKAPCKMHIVFGKLGWLVMFPINNNQIAKIFDIHSYDLMWKTKWSEDDYRYEYFPYIIITFFHKWQIAIKFIIDTSRYSKDSWESTQDYWWEKYLSKINGEV